MEQSNPDRRSKQTSRIDPLQDGWGALLPARLDSQDGQLGTRTGLGLPAGSGFASAVSVNIQFSSRISLILPGRVNQKTQNSHSFCQAEAWSFRSVKNAHGPPNGGVPFCCPFQTRLGRGTMRKNRLQRIFKSELPLRRCQSNTSLDWGCSSPRACGPKVHLARSLPGIEAAATL